MPQIRFIYQRKIIICQEGETIRDVARAHHIPIYRGWRNLFNCHGLGLCSSCQVRVIRTDHVSPPTLRERIKLLRSPWRLACQARVYKDIMVWTQGTYPVVLPLTEEEQRQVTTAPGHDQQEPLVEEIFPESVKHLLDQGRPIVLLDVREPFEFEKVHIPGSVLIPLGQLQHRLGELDRDAEIITYCHHGMRSMTAASILRASGFQHVRSMAGGIDGWSLKVDFSLPRY